MKKFNLMNWFRKNRNVILLTTVGGFLISTFIGFGLYSRFGVSPIDSVLEVNGEKISYKRYLSLYNYVVHRQKQEKTELTPEDLAQIKNDIIQSLIQETVLKQQANRYGFEVSDTELANSLASVPAFQKEGKFDPNRYIQALQYSLHTSPEEFETNQKNQILIQRLRSFIVQSVKISDPELKWEFEKYLKTLTEKEKKEAIKTFEEDPEVFRKTVHQQKATQALNLWYQQLGTNLEVKVTLDQIEKRLGKQQS